MILKSERIILVPLTLKQLEDSIEDKDFVEIDQGLEPSGQLTNFMEIVYKIKIRKIKLDNINYLFYTYWQIISIKDNRVIGRVGFKNIPNAKGEVEIGYAIDEKYRRRYFMTEAAMLITRWAFKQESVKSVVAITQKHNYPSQCVLKKINMTIINEDDKFYKWSIEKEKFSYISIGN